MAGTAEIKRCLERNARVVKLKPARGRYSSTTRVRVRDGLTCDIEDGAWKLVADMGKSSGGDEIGPTPGTLGRAALGSCLAIAIVQWAAALDVPVDGVDVEVVTDADAAGAYGVSDDVPAGYRRVRCLVTVNSAAPEQDVVEMIDTATRRCIYWDVFARAMDMKREVRILPPGE